MTTIQAAGALFLASLVAIGGPALDTQAGFDSFPNPARTLFHAEAEAPPQPDPGADNSCSRGEAGNAAEAGCIRLLLGLSDGMDFPAND